MIKRLASPVTRLMAVSAFCIAASVPVESRAQAASGWDARLEKALAGIDAQGTAKIGVYVRDLDTGVAASWKADQRWYLASMVKVPVAIAVLRGVEREQYTLDTKVSLRASDYVDGAGRTNSYKVGRALSIRFLLDQMIIYSDNTATDMLIDLVGAAGVNAVVESLVPDRFREITSLSDVRHQIYANLVTDTTALTGHDLILLNRQRVDTERLKLLATMTGTPVERFKLKNLDAAYNAYYASGVNSAPLTAYADLLQLLADGKALTPRYTDYLLKVMERVATGKNRLKAGLPPDMKFAHKTGTQRRRICDAGLLRFAEDGRERRAIVVACVRDEPSLVISEHALVQVGAAICKSGLLTRGNFDAPLCQSNQPKRSLQSLNAAQDANDEGDSGPGIAAGLRRLPAAPLLPAR
ncbi:MAG: serine hydrolase [Comamonadaceae bacterium]|nr:MAG: serine hydrolase [Comamonadaceae bacterium]